jgi:hypothetical protein
MYNHPLLLRNLLPKRNSPSTRMRILQYCHAQGEKDYSASKMGLWVDGWMVDGG